MNKYFFSIAALKILILSENELKFNNLLLPFKCETEDYDIKCTIIEDMQPLAAIKENGKKIYGDDIVTFYAYEGFTYRVFKYYCGEYFVKFKKEDPIDFEIHTPKIINGNITYLHDLLCFDIACLYFDGFKIHSSFVKYNDRAILFSAPSQTGKSTQAELWRKHKSAEIINGDKVFLRKIKEEWFACGSPWAGTSKIYKNECVKAPALVILRQASENRIIEVSTAKAVSLILSQTHTQCWNADDANRICELIEDFVAKNPVFILECRPDFDAVKIVDNFLLNYS